MKLLLLPFAALVALAAGPDKPIDRLGISSPLRFNQTAFSLAWSSKPTATFYIQEYLPKGENVEHFNQLLTLRLINQDADLRSAVNEKITELEARKKTDVMCHYQVITNEQSKEVVVDFLVSDKIGDPQAIVEFNVYRYQQVAVGATKRGVLIYAYSRRSYGSTVQPFLKGLTQTRRGAIDEMAKAKMPVVKLSGN